MKIRQRNQAGAIVARLPELPQTYRFADGRTCGLPDLPTLAEDGWEEDTDPDPIPTPSGPPPDPVADVQRQVDVLTSGLKTATTLAAVRTAAVQADAAG
jgi:hypothetical protein